VLAIFPGLAALVALYGLIADRTDVAQNLQSVRPLLPLDAYSLLESQVRSLAALLDTSKYLAKSGH
jgi:membrane protein